MKFIRKKLNEGYFKNPEQMKAAKERTASMTNTEKLANTAINMVIPAVKKFICENADLRLLFSKTLCKYIKSNPYNSIEYSPLDLGSCTYDGLDNAIKGTFISPKCKINLNDLTFSNIFIITNVEIINKNMNNGEITVDLDCVIGHNNWKTPCPSVSEMTDFANLYSCLQINEAGIFNGQPGAETY